MDGRPSPRRPFRGWLILAPALSHDNAFRAACRSRVRPRTVSTKMRHDDISGFVAARLKVLREARGYSLRQLAHRCELTPEMLSRAERGERTPSLETLAKVCSGLQMSLSAFFDSDARQQTQPSSELGELGAGRVQMECIPRFVRKRMLDDQPASPVINSRAREHFLDAIRSIERGLKRLEEPEGQRRRKRSTGATPASGQPSNSNVPKPSRS